MSERHNSNHFRIDKDKIVALRDNTTSTRDHSDELRSISLEAIEKSKSDICASVDLLERLQLVIGEKGDEK